ncbi:MAG: lipopolysaccharide transport periplasmic protein LptA [Thermodesulfovibrionia bacterium]
MALTEKKEGRRVVITSDTLMADNKSSTAIFEGSVVATIDNVTIHSEKMTVFYDNSGGTIKTIQATGNVRVNKGNSVIFSNDATYIGNEEKIIFTGEPKLVDGDNVITGKQIIYSMKDEKAFVEGSRVVLKVKGDKENALLRDKGN